MPAITDCGDTYIFSEFNNGSHRNPTICSSKFFDVGKFAGRILAATAGIV